jgi:glucosamine--fructose-6-phosphate aminotransferase (isomerizing)
MCGIIAVLRRASLRTPPGPQVIEQAVAKAAAALAAGHDVENLGTAAEALATLDRELRGVPGLLCTLAAPAVTAACRQRLATLQAEIAAYERSLDQDDGTDAFDPALEQRNAALVRLKDALWSVLKDRIPHAEAVRDLAGGDVPHPAAAAAFSSLQSALSALDRLEVRGRDSAGITVFVTGIDLQAPRARQLLLGRTGDPLFQHRSARAVGGVLNIVYKHAAEIGDLGDNVRALRTAMRADPLLQWALREPRAEALVLGHTRWASIGIISQPNCHPLNQEEVGRENGPYVVAVLNGDVDNHEELKDRSRLQIAPEITTDTKVIPTLVSRQLATGVDFAEAFRRTVAGFEGSVAIGAATVQDMDRLALALRGSGQALYIGLAEDTFVVASEPYGVIEDCDRYLRMDGETPGNPKNPQASRGQVVVLSRARAGEVDGIARMAYDGTALPVTEQQLTRAAVTTRDIDRAGFRHFLHKEISEAPVSWRKTLRGRIVRRAGRLQAVLPAASLPAAIAQALGARRFRRLLVIGQGTAAVAGQAVAEALQRTLARTAIAVRALPATELSGFGLADDMQDTLVVAISQSGTTTDTNRTVDLLRARGAPVLAIVNRRGSDLTDKADGVIYTSDGRDVEMSVASTKAFYAQCAAGTVLALCLARAAGVADDAAEHELLQAMTDLPKAMQAVLAQDAAIAAVAEQHAPPRRHWALVGNGRNRIAAEEVRIKLSELCYKSIACDATEDKKHIDLSSEPLILVCAAGLEGSLADDVAKEVAIYRAHKACPIVIATAGQERFTAAAATIVVPAAHPALAFVLSTMAGHVFGYRAALAIDALTLPLRRMRGAIEEVLGDPHLRREPLEHLGARLAPPWRTFRQALAAGRYDGALDARSAVRLSSLLGYAMALVPLDSFAIEYDRPGTPGVLIDTLTAELTSAIDQLTRPVDAIKHQAKTVTVGISRSDEALLTVPLVRAVLAAGAGRDRLGYRDLRALAALDAAVVEVLGSTRYRIDGEVEDGKAVIAVTGVKGIAKQLRSRTADNPTLKGTKHLVAMERLCLVAKGRSDDRTVILVPEVEHNRTTGITLLHVRFAEQLPAAALRSVLGSYRNRYAALKDAVTETESDFDEELLAQMPVVDLLTEPIYVLADRWRQGTGKPA